VKAAVLAPDVDDERRRRAQPGDVGEVLFGADANVDAAARLDQRAFSARRGSFDTRFESGNGPAGSDSDSLSAQNAPSSSACGSVDRWHAAVANANEQAAGDDGESHVNRLSPLQCAGRA
jgi:hypothetical protein